MYASNGTSGSPIDVIREGAIALSNELFHLHDLVSSIISVCMSRSSMKKISVLEK